MKVPETLAQAFGHEFENWITDFAVQKKWIEDSSAVRSHRFLSRSIIPHIQRLSSVFNREDQDQGASLEKYWKQGSHPAHLRLAYFLYFMPANLYRVASIWAELSRLGFRWPHSDLKAIEFGAGPASGACGIAAGEAHAATGLPQVGSWALIEQDKAMLDIGNQWSQTYFNHLGFSQWRTLAFHRTLQPESGFLPKAAPKFNLWLMSYFLNESQATPRELAESLIRDWNHHLTDDSLVIIVEPALKLQSRRLLELRKEIIQIVHQKKLDWLKVLLPCLGHQNCGALAQAEDWCHEEVSWWRPPYYRIIDDLARLDRKTLPFSYLVLAKTRRPREELLPAFQGSAIEKAQRLVSPVHFEGKDQEFFVCGQDGKRKARYRSPSKEDPPFQRGTLLLEPEIRGDQNSSRVDSIKKSI